MNKTLVLCILLSQWLSMIVYSASLSQEQRHNMQPIVKTKPAKSEWRAATYRGLTIGKSTGADMLRVLGKPQWSGPPGDQTEDDANPEIWNEYDSGGEFPGKLTVVVGKLSNVILRIDLDPENLSKEEAIRHFGDEYIVTRYDFDECLSDGESAPMYESPNGSLVYIEYRGRGIALAIDSPNTVQYISYVKDPIGAASSKCKQMNK